LAIFNSCDGLGLANQLADLGLPQSIVMREPIPDSVAQVFLTHFLDEFIGEKKSLYASVREARLSLERFEKDYPGVVWLPVICQNLTAEPLIWPKPKLTFFNKVLFSILIAVSIVGIFLGLIFKNSYISSPMPSDEQTVLPVEDQNSELTQKLARQLGIDKKAAESFLTFISELGVDKKVAKSFLIFISEIRHNLSDIASDKTSIIRKDRLIRRALKDFFSPTSEVHFSSLRSKKVTIMSQPAKYYLEDLSNLSERSFSTVEVLFDKNYLSLEKIKLFDSNKKFGLKVNMWQKFKGCYNDKSGCYVDYTEKGFYFILSNVNGSWDMKIHLITTEQTVPFREGSWQ
jgi:hypothetical protein